MFSEPIKYTELKVNSNALGGLWEIMFCQYTVTLLILQLYHTTMIGNVGMGDISKNFFPKVYIFCKPKVVLKITFMKNVCNIVPLIDSVD